MRRKVIQIGNSTQLISLPRKWAQLHGVKKGDELDVTEQGSKVVISTSREGEPETATINLPTKDKFLTRPLHILYKMGFDEIIVNYKDLEIIELIQAQTENMLGLELVDHKGTTCILKNVASAMESEFDSLLRRIFLMMTSLASDVVDAVKSGDLSKLQEIERREKRNDRLVLFCQRLLIKKGYKEHKRTCMIYEILAHLENVADDYRYLCLHILDKKPDFNKEEIKLMGDITELMTIYHKLFYTFSLENLIKFKKLRLDVEKRATSMMAGKNARNPLVHHYLLSITQRIHTMTESLSLD